MKLRLIEKSLLVPAPIVRQAGEIADRYGDIETVALELHKHFPTLFVYRGGHHVAVHPASHTAAYFRIVEVEENEQ